MKNSRRASSATTPVSAATSAVGPHHTSATTTGISTAAVKIRAAVPELAPHLEFAVGICLLGKFIPAAAPELPDAPRGPQHVPLLHVLGQRRPARRNAARASGSLPVPHRVPHAENRATASR